jgi:hypothetical protein
MSPHLHDTLSTALLEARSIPAIEKVLSQSLAEAGWTNDLRNYIQKLVRTGECTNYQQILQRVLGEVTTGKEARTNGAADKDKDKGEEGGELKIPEKVVREGVKVVRKELERVVTVVVDD